MAEKKDFKLEPDERIELRRLINVRQNYPGLTKDVLMQVNESLKKDSIHRIESLKFDLVSRRIIKTYMETVEKSIQVLKEKSITVLEEEKVNAKEIHRNGEVE